MDKTELVGEDLSTGRQVIQALEAQGIPVDVAAWFQEDESGTWQLVIASSTVEKSGPKVIYQVISAALVGIDSMSIELDDVRVASLREYFVRDLIRLIRTGDELQAIRLRGLDLGGQSFKDSYIYRVKGSPSPKGWMEFDARVRVKATGQLGTVRGVINTAHGPRFLVLYDRDREDVRPLDDQPRRPIGQDYAESDLDFLYAVRPGGWPEKPPLIAQPA